MRKLILTFFITVFFINANAQGSTYRTALGVKVGSGGGISFKHFVSGNNALELIGYFWRQGIRITGLYEIHGPFAGTPGFQWYIGPGGHVGFYKTNFGDGTFIGIDGVLGLDYKFNEAPINLSLDWQPSFEFGENRGYAGSFISLGVRYTFR